MSEENFEEEKQHEEMSGKEFIRRNFSHASGNWKNAGPLKKAWMILLSLIVGGGIITALTLGLMGIVVVAGIIIGSLMVFVFLLISIAMIVGKLHLSKKWIDWNVPAREGVVLSCALHTETSTIDTGATKARRIEKAKILTSIYQLKVEVEGKVKYTYDTKQYNVGDKVSLRQHKLIKSILIVE